MTFAWFRTAAAPRIESGAELWFETFSVPILPKVGVLTNLHAMLVASVGVVLLAIWNDLKGTELIYLWSHTIPCFFVGLMCGMASIALGFVSVHVDELAPRAGGWLRGFLELMRSANALTSAALCAMLLSNLIFIAATSYAIFVTWRALAVAG
jgi:hypothetical protein